MGFVQKIGGLIGLSIINISFCSVKMLLLNFVAATTEGSTTIFSQASITTGTDSYITSK